MTSAKAWIAAMRLRTLPLAISSILMGCALSYRPTPRFWLITGLAILTAALLQILSNFANDYGDFVKGTDDDTRVGPTRTMQAGLISRKAMIKAMVVVVIMALISGLALIKNAFFKFSQDGLIMLIIGIAAIASAILYTVGKKAYGYSGLGDLFVFVFFGLVGVGGTYFLHRLQFDWYVLLPAAAIGLFATSVLNLNNMRDMKKDEAKGKITIPVRVGTENSKTYHAFLILIGWLLIALYFLGHFSNAVQLILFLPAIVFARNLKLILGDIDLETINPELKKIALATFGLGVCFLISSIFIFHF